MTRVRKAVDEPDADGVAGWDEYDRNRRSMTLRCCRRTRPSGHQELGSALDKLAHGRSVSGLVANPDKVDDHVLILDDTGFAQALAECLDKRLVKGVGRRAQWHEADPSRTVRLL